jgi:NAD(P)-dependent dehydrogenase (short-subunit alcohol dehydrogenase family)
VDWIITGASRGIGLALAQALAARAQEGDRIFALARDRERLEALASTAGSRAKFIAWPADLARIGEARRAGTELAARVQSATLIHNAGVWPTQRTLIEGFESGFATNCLGPLALQQPLLAAGRVSRVLVVSAGILIKGRFDPERTPSGEDFSAFRTYANSKLAGAAAMREAARRYPDVDFAIIHPGVVHTDLGATRGPLGWLMKLAKRSWEAPEVCAARLVRILERPKWQHAKGEAPWFVEESEQPWPAQVDGARESVAASVARYLGA